MRFRKKRFGKRGSYRGFSRRSRGRSNGGSSGLKWWEVLIGAVIYALVRPFVANNVPTFFSFGPLDSDNVIIGGAGYLGYTKGKGIIKATGLAAMVGEASIVASNFASGQKAKQVGPASGSSGAIADPYA